MNQEQVTTKLNSLRNNPDNILDCDVKDQTGLNDFQKIPDKSGISIPKVGIERFRTPLTFEHSHGSMSHDCEVSMFVELSSGKTGVNMSRFCQILQGESNDVMSKKKILEIVRLYRTLLRDYDTDPLLKSSSMTIDFKLPVKQTSLNSDNWGWQYYDCKIEAQESQDHEAMIALTMNYEYSSTCPCSLSMAKQYEEDFREGKTTLGSGIAVAHSQRSNAQIKAQVDINSNYWFEDLLTVIKFALPTETQSLVKRVDEQAFAILNGENPMFVEHASRRLSLALDNESSILDWSAKVEHFESLHSHNAVAIIYKEGGKQLSLS